MSLSALPSFDVVVAKDVMIPVRDGVHLATDIYRPARGVDPAQGRFPAILVRTSIGKDHREWLPQREFFPAHGYALVIQDIRSRFKSEGDGRYFHTCNPWEGDDGFDTVEWIAAQAWSSGAVGMMGSSHRAIVQTQAALHRPPHLRAICPEQGPTNIYLQEAREGGAMALHMYTAIYAHALDAQEIRDNPDAVQVLVDGMVHTREWLQRTPFRRGKIPLSVAPHLESTLFNYYLRGEYDEWWAQECNDQTVHWDRHADIPCLITGGWFDPFVDAVTGYFEAMTKRNRSPSRMVIGPWGHGTMRSSQTHFGEVEFGANAAQGFPKHNELRLKWFDRWLKEDPNGIDREPPVEIFVMGGGSGRRTLAGRIEHGGHWRTEREWPIRRTRRVTLFMQQDGRLTSEQPASANASLSFVFDPERPVPTAGGSTASHLGIEPPARGGLPDSPPYGSRTDTYGAFFRPVVPWGPMHQSEREWMIGVTPPFRALMERPDILVFQSDPLREDTEVTGRVEASLSVSSSAVDTDFTIKLVDVYAPSADFPSGFHLNLCDTILRCRYRKSWTEPELMDPGKIYEITIPLPTTSNLFAAGHRIRVDISSSNFPRFDVNPNTGEPVGQHTHSVRANNTVFVNAAHPSRVVLPVIPSS